MGQFLAIGLRISAAISKKDVEKHLDDETSVDDILGQIETKYRLSDIYERKEKDGFMCILSRKTFLTKSMCRS